MQGGDHASGLQALLGSIGQGGAPYAQRQNSVQFRALVYENDPPALRLLVDLLQSQGVYVMPSLTPQDLAASISRDHYDIIFFAVPPAASQINTTFMKMRYLVPWERTPHSNALQTRGTTGCRKSSGPNKFAALIGLCNVGQQATLSYADDYAYKPLIEADVILMVDCWVWGEACLHIVPLEYKQHIHPPPCRGACPGQYRTRRSGRART